MVEPGNGMMTMRRRIEDWRRSNFRILIMIMILNRRKWVMVILTMIMMIKMYIIGIREVVVGIWKKDMMISMREIRGMEGMGIGMMIKVIMMIDLAILPYLSKYYVI